MSLRRKAYLKNILLALLFISSTYSKVAAQHNIRDSTISFSMIGVTFAYQMPGGDMAKRFGDNLNVGGLFQWKFKSNWMIGFEGDFLFSEHVKENNILDKYRTPDGNIIDFAGQYASIYFYERGMNLSLKGGKIFPIIGPNMNSGLMTTLAAGYMQHKILIETPGSKIPYLDGDNRKGFDRLSSGLSLTEFIGYMNFGNKKLVNFYIGFEFTQAFTKNRRAINFDTGVHDDASRTDLLFGIRVGWVLPIYRRVADKIYIN